MEYMKQLSLEQREALTDIFDRCFFSNKNDKTKFWLRVWEAGEVEAGEPISQDSFELCLLKAKDILFDRGVDIFTRKRAIINNPAFQGLRK